MASPIATSSKTTLGRALRSFSSRTLHQQVRLLTASTTLTAVAPDANVPATDLPVTDAPITDSPVTDANPAQSWTSDEVERRRMRQSVLNEFSGLGSEQRRANTFRPYKARLEPIDARKLTLSHLVAATAQVGHTLGSLKVAHQPYIYGHRHGIAIFDLERATLPSLRRAATVVKAVTERDGIVLFVGTRPGQKAAVLAATKRLGENGFHVTAERWMPGAITNAPKLLSSAILQTIQDQESLSEINPNKLASQTLQPDLVIVLNPVENSSVIREATQANIPTMAITDSDVDPRCVTYPIPANDDSIRAVELIVGVLSKAGEEGTKLRAQKLDDAEKLERKMQKELNRRITDANFDPRTRFAPAQNIQTQHDETL